MSHGTVEAIFISSLAGMPMHPVKCVQARARRGLEGDRCAAGKGSFQQGKCGCRQVTLMNIEFFKGSGFNLFESRRNIFTRDIELMRLIGKRFRIGNVVFIGEKYCYPCDRPSDLSGKRVHSFKKAFSDRGGLVAKIFKGGIIKVGDRIIPLPKKPKKKTILH